MKSLIQIITPVYNEGSVLFETLACLKKQTLKAFEWIIVNDGSSKEDTLQILSAIEKQESWITVINHATNQGLPAARNTGIKASAAPYLLFLDADDLIAPTFIEKAYLCLRSNAKFDFVNSYVIGFGAQNYKWTGGFHDREVFLHENRNTSCFLAKREVFDQVLFDESMRAGCEDWDFWLNAASKKLWGYTIPEYLFFYRRSASNKWATLDGEEELKKIQSQLYGKYASELLLDFPVKEFSKYVFGHTSLFTHNEFDNSSIGKPENKSILFIFPWLKIGGADQYNYNLLSGLKKRGWNITIITTLGKDHPWEEKFMEVTEDILHLGNLAEETAYAGMLEHAIAIRAPRLIFLSNSMYGYYALPFIKQRFPQIPVVDYVHCEDIGWYGGGYPYFSALYSGLLSASYTTSNNLKSWCIDKGGDATKLDVKYISVDTTHIQRNPQTRDRIREELGLNAKTVVILYVARLTEQKQPDVLVATLNALQSKNLPFKCLIIGDGPEQGSLLNALDHNNLHSHVSYLGSQPNDKVMQYMDAADIFFLPSKYEGIALSIFEAMAKELAIVGANVGGQAELVTAGCGYLVEAENKKQSVVAYAAILEKLIKDPKLVTKLGQNSRERVVTHFDLESMVNGMHESFLKVISAEPAGISHTDTSYLLLLNRMLHLEKDNAALWDKANSRIFTTIDKYREPYSKLRSIYTRLKKFVKE